MRTPSDLAPLYNWWREALEGNVGPIYEDEPCCGFYKYKNRRIWNDVLQKNERKPPFKAVIWLDQPLDEHGKLENDELITAMVNGVYVDAIKMWSYVAKSPITEKEYNEMEILND